MPAVPTTTAIVKSHKNKRSSTIATYFQSSFTYYASPDSSERKEERAEREKIIVGWKKGQAN
jgi:hypothetical protein